MKIDKTTWIMAPFFIGAVFLYLVHVVVSIVEGRWWWLIILGFPPLGMIHGAMHVDSWF